MNLVRKIAENYKLPYFTMSPTYSVCKEHGYIEGEHWTCPKCGGKTEVYSRITGYYRPLQNWNDGKIEEFKERKEYVLGSSHLKAKDGHACEMEKEATGTKQITDLMLFTSPTCPNCKLAKMLLDQANIKYTNIDAIENKDTTIAYGVTKAPTLLVPHGDHYDVYENASLIKGYIEKSKIAC